MEVKNIFDNKSLKPSERTKLLCSWLTHNPAQIDTLISFAKNAKDPVKAACIEAVEYATKENPKICTANCFEFIIASLNEKSPAIKREAGRVIANTAKVHVSKIESALTGLLNNSEHEGTVVRWSAATAIGQIILLKTSLNKDLIPVAEAICEREEKNSIKKIYLAAIKKVTK